MTSPIDHNSHPATPSVLARLAALKTATMPELKQQWHDLFGGAAPAFNRAYVESRLAYRIQELAYGGLKPETLRRLKALGEEVAGKKGKPRRTTAAPHRPVTGTRLVREWQGVEQCVTVREDGCEFEGRPYKSLSAVARAITGTQWNGWAFFGLRGQRGGDR